jgi:hypothetical protein
MSAMDLTTGDRTATTADLDEPAAPARPVPPSPPDGADEAAGATPGGLDPHANRVLAWLAVVAASASAIALARFTGVVGRGGVAEALRVAAATVVLFAITGFGATRLLLPAPLRRHEAVWVLPVGAVVMALALGSLGYAHVPFDLSLGLVLAGGVALGVVAWRHDPGLIPRSVPAGATSWRMLLVALYVAALVGAIALLPMFRGGFATVIGNGSDAHLAVGTAQFLQSHTPGEVAIEEPVDQVPLVWRSKPPIYLAFGAVARLAGMEPYAVIATLAAALLAFAALGFWLLARELLGAGPWAAGAVLGIVGLNRVELFTVMHPYFNQTWGYMAMPFAIVLAWYTVRERTFGGLALLAAFLAVLAFAYPLALPIPLMSAVAFYVFDRRRRGLRMIPRPRVSRRRLVWIVPLCLLLGAVPVQGVIEKTSAARRVLTGGDSLVNWGGDLIAFIPERFFLGLAAASTAAIAIPLMALGLVLALRRAPRDVSWGLGVVIAFGLAAAFYFRPRDYGWYFHFKALAFVAPIAVAAAVVGLSGLRRRWLSIVAVLFVLGATRSGAADELSLTFDQLPKSLLELKTVDARLPPDASLRLDMPADGRMLWAGIMLSGQPLCSQRPIMETSYPHVPVSRAADYVLVDDDLQRPFDAVGSPVMRLDRFLLLRLRPGLPGGDRCSRRMVQTVTRLQ